MAFETIISGLGTMKETRPPNESREDKDEVETSFHRFVPPAIEKKRRKEIDLKRGVYHVIFFVPVVAMAFSMRYQAHPDSCVTSQVI